MVHFHRDNALYRQVADRVRRELLVGTEPGTRLPSDGELSERWQVSVRTIREALLMLEAEGRVARRRGSGTFVRACEARPVALYSELNLLHPRTPRFFGLTLDLVRRHLGKAGYSTRLYTGRSQAGDPTGPFTGPELVADAQAGRLSAIAALTSKLDDPALLAMQAQGLPTIAITDTQPITRASGVRRIPDLAVPYLANLGRRRIGLIGWDAPEGEQSMLRQFRQALQSSGLPFHPEWCRVEYSFAWEGAAWEEFREIWFARPEKPDALVIADENYFSEVVVALLQLGLRIPRDVLIVSHRSQGARMLPPFPVAWVEMNVEAFAEHFAAMILATLRGQPVPPVPADYVPFRLLPLANPPSVPAPKPVEPSPLESTR